MFTPRTSLQKVCGVKCSVEYTKFQRAVDPYKPKRKKRIKAEVDNDKSYQLKKAQDKFNEFIRLRDHDQPCISCGEFNPPMTRGGQWDAGHYRSRGAIKALRFNEFNVNRQCKVCNGGSKYQHKAESVKEGYERRLREKIGDKKVDWLNNYRELKKWTIEEYKEIFRIYSEKVNNLRAELGLT